MKNLILHLYRSENGLPACLTGKVGRGQKNHFPSAYIPKIIELGNKRIPNLFLLGIIICLAFISSIELWGQAPGVYEARVVSVSSYVDSEEPIEGGGPDVTWKLDMAFKGSVNGQLGTIVDENDLWYHKSYGYNPEQEYNPGWPSLTTPTYFTSACPPRVYFEFKIIGFEKDFPGFPKNEYDSFDDFYRGSHGRISMLKWVREPHIWYPASYIVRSASGDPLYKFTFEFRYSIDIIKPLAIRAERIGGGSLPPVICEGDAYVLRAQTNVGNSASFVWERRLDQTSTWLPYSHIWRQDAITVQASVPGYHYRVRAAAVANACLGDTMWQISPPPPLAIPRAPQFYQMEPFVKPTCVGQTDGSITVIPYNYTPTGTYDLTLKKNGVVDTNHTGVTFPFIFNNLDSGNYTLKVTRPQLDIGQCTGILKDLIIHANPIPTPEIPTVVQHQLCFGVNSGQIRVVPQQNPSPYFEFDTLLLTGPENRTGYAYRNPRTFGALPPGDYFLQVARGGCTTPISGPYTINGVAGPITGTATVTNPLCGGEGGTIYLENVMGGTQFTGSFDYKVRLSGYPIEDFNIAKLYTRVPPGTYTFTIYDANGCVGTIANVVVNAPPSAPNVTLDSMNATACDPVGSIFATGSGGVGPYEYSLDPMTNGWQPSNTFNDLTPGYYTVFMRDVSHCETSAQQLVQGVNAINLIVTQNATTCFDSVTAVIRSDQSGGNTSSPYIIELFDAANTTTPIQTETTSNGTFDFTDLSAGNYVVRVTDIDGCEANAPIMVRELPKASIVAVDAPSPACNYNSLPQIEIEIEGRSSNTLPFPARNLEVSISGDPYDPTTMGVNNGVTRFYRFPADSLDGNFVLRDAFGCPIDTLRTFDRTRPEPVIVNIISVDSASCEGVHDGSITFTVTGAVKPYNAYLLIKDGMSGVEATIASTSEDTLTFSNLRSEIAYFGEAGGGYYIQVDDNLENPGITCSVSTPSFPFATSLYEPQKLSVTGVSQGPLLDCEGKGGTILATAMGGTAPYEYSLDGVQWQTSPLLTGAIDTNDIFVRDARSCQSVTDSNYNPNTVIIDYAPVPIVINSIITTQGSVCSPQRDSIILDGIDQGFVVNSVNILWNNCSGGTVPGTSAEANLVKVEAIGTNYLVVENLIQNFIPAGCTEVQEGIMVFNLTDSNSCVKDIMVPIKVKNRPPTLSVQSKIGVTCSGDTNGMITLRVVDSLFIAGSAGSIMLSPPFTVSINNQSPQTTSTPPYEVTIVNLDESVFTVSVIDANGCSSLITDSIGRFSPYDLTIVKVPITGCGTDSTGSIAVTVNSGSNLPFNWTWYSDANMAFVPYGPTETLNAGETTTLSNLPATTVRAIISDANTCVDTIDFGVEAPIVLSLQKADSTNATCFGAADGTVSVNPLGGTLPLQLSIDGSSPQTDTTFTGLTAGEHLVTVMDNNGCIDTVRFYLTEPAPILVDDITITNATCFGEVDGQIQIAASGGAGSLEYALDAGNFQPIGLFTALSAGSYTITVKDLNLCTIDTMNLQVMQPPALTSTISISDSITCIQDAILVASASGGTAGYQYEWDGGASAIDTLYNAGVGEHVVRITDNLGCVHFDTIQLTLPDVPVLALVADTTEACGQANGSFLISVTNGTSPYNFTANGQTNMTGYFNGLAKNVYEAVVSDSKGCADTLMVTIDSVGSPVISQIDTVQTTCATDDGSITLTVVDGSPTYEYKWSHDVNLNSPMATGLGEGTYTVTVTDQRQCFVIRSINLTQTESPVLSVLQQVSSACGQNNGMGIVSVLGGSPMYTFSWSHDNTITGPSASNLAPATYEVIVIDQNGCRDSVDVVITEDAPPMISVVDSTNATCGLTNGSITLTSTGINAPFIYTWSHNAGILDSVATNLAAGTYNITVTDARNCTDLISFVLTNSAGPSLSVVEFKDNQCAAGNGFIRVTGSGGSSPLTYTWSHDGALTDSFATGLVADVYTITLTDQNNCSQTISQTIVDDNLLSATISNIQASGCDTATGSIEIMAVGGEPGYTYTWSHNAALDTNYVDDLAAGNYIVTVTDALACSFILNGTVGTATGPTISLVSTNNSLCGPDMGSATVSATSGASPYTYEWSHDASITDSFATNLPGGGIIVTVRDANNCTDNVSFIIDETPGISLTFVSSMDETCEANNGQITTVHSGGTNPIMYSWSHDLGLNSPSATNLSAGTYTVSVTDNVGCSDTITTVIDSVPSPVIQLISSQNNACDQANGSIFTMVSSGTPTYVYAWSHDATLNSPNATGLTGGTYTLIVTDGSACADTLVATIADEDVLVISEVSVTATGCGANTGMIVASVEGGMEPYMYNWSHDGALMDSVAQGLAAGAYTLIVSDAVGCQDTLLFNVTMAASPVMTLNSTQANECGQANGQIIVDVSGGSIPYTYSWSHDMTLNDSIAPNLLDGQYRVTVSDVNGCTDTLSIVLTCETSLSVTSVDTVDETCSLMNGSISVFPGGGSPPYSYAWSHNAGLNNPKASNLAAGPYTVTITDGANSMITYTHTLSNTPGPELSLISLLNNNCPTAANGAITVSASSGVGPYSFQWSHDAAITASMANGLNAGLYQIIVSDANGCADSISQTIIDENLLAASFSNVAPSQCAMASGSIVVTPSLGRPPYMYTWSHDATLTDSIAMNLSAGMYSISVTDVSGCQLVVDTQVVLTASPMITLVESLSSSCDLSNGSARVTASGGPRPFVYTWSHDASITDSLANGLAAGSYMVTVTDNNGCFDALNITIDGSPAVVLSASAIVNESCDLSNGSITLSTTGGTAPFNYSWSHDMTLTGPTATNLPSGNYVVIVSDQLMCLDTIVIDLTNTPAVSAQVVAFNHNACTQANGTITIGVTTGSAPYSFAWSHDVNLTASIANGLSAGMYAVIVTDANGCLDTVDHEVLDLPVLSIALVQLDSTACAPGTGRVEVGVNGGSGNYTYSWSHNAGLNSNIAAGLMAGTYTVSVVDDRGCMVELTAVVAEFTGPALGNIIIMSTQCGLSTGSIELFPVGGLAPYTYSWTHNTALTGPLAAGLSSGVYSYEITDARNCTFSGMAVMPSSTDIEIDLVVLNRPACFMSNGSITISTTGGVNPVTIEWFNANDLSTVISTDAMISDLPAGTYVVMVKDADNCDDIEVYVLNDLDDMAVLTLSYDESCFYNNDGQAHANVVGGGTAPFAYQWDDVNASTTKSLTSLGAGTYRLTITDFNGCIYTDSIEITQPDEITIDTVVVASGCGDPASGAIIVTGHGGTGDLQYVWQDGFSGPTRLNLLSGMYSVAVIDSASCQVIFDIEVPDSDDITVTAGDVIQPACDGSVGGSVSVDVIGGQSPYQFSWNDPLAQTDQTASNLLPGRYRVTVTDLSGCSDTLSMLVPDVMGLTLMPQEVVQPACVDDTNGEIEIQVAGGSGNYGYLWDDMTFQTTSRAVGLGEGQYIVRVTDLDLGCISRDTIILVNPAAIVIDSFVTLDVNCFGGTTGSSKVFAAGGTGSLTYVWDDDMNQMTDLAAGLVEGNYQVTITDENLCSIQGSVTISEPEELIVSVTDSMGISCNGLADGKIKVLVEGGTGPYTIFWPELNVSGDSVVDVESIFYTVQITDDRGCMIEDMVRVSEPDAISIELIDLVNPACAAGQAGQIQINASGGTGVLQYLWDDDLMQITPTAFNLDSGNYSVIVTDENLCTDTMSYEITGQSELIISIVDSITPSCFGDANGVLTVTVTGGNDDYVYLWDDPMFQINPSATNLGSGQYILFVSNGDGSCPTFDTIALDQPELLTSMLIDAQDVSCFGDMDGTIVWDIAGGTIPYKIDWTGIGSDLGDSLNMLIAGDYKITIEDNNGCVTLDSTTINEPAELILSLDATDPLCFGDMDGDILASVGGGTSPYSYAWSTAATDTLAQINNLLPGSYTVSVTDENGCMEINSSNLEYMSDEINFTLIETIVPSCVGADNGLLSLSASGGSGNLSYQWSNGVLLPLNDMLLPAIYDVTITDVLGCSIDTTFDLSEVTSLDVEIGFSDTLICQNQVITFGPDEIPGAVYSWVGPNGFTSSTPSITVSQPGNYSLSVTASICMDVDDVNVMNSSGVLQSHFILPTQVVVGDTIVILERSWPTPDELDWIIATDSVVFVSQINDQWIYTFPFAGQFNIGLSAQFGDCNAYIEKTIIVHPDSSTFVVPQSTGDKQILSFSVSPNPSVGFFDVAFNLAQNMPYNLSLYRIDGTVVENRQDQGVGELTEDFNLSMPANGLYIVSLSSGAETVWKILTIERP